jgi:hypothetical protein
MGFAFSHFEYLSENLSCMKAAARRVEQGIDRARKGERLRPRCTGSALVIEDDRPAPQCQVGLAETSRGPYYN